MYLKVKVHPNAKKNEVVTKAEDSFEVHVRAKPVEGRANDAVLDLLSAFLGIPRNRLRLIRGSTSRNKIVERID